jgi:co-chaperonin GroES (HSP10)
MSEFILRGNRILIDKPEKKEKKEGELDLIVPDNMEKDAEKEMMKEWTHLNVSAVGTDVEDVKVGDKVYIKTGALHNAEIMDLDGSIKMMVTIHDVVMIWK